MDTLSNKRDGVATGIMVQFDNLQVDTKVRFLLPVRVIGFINLNKAVLLVDKGNTLKVWKNQDGSKEYYIKSRKYIRKKLIYYTK